MRKQLIIVTIALLGICQFSTARADGWYFSEGFGSSQLSGKLGEHLDGTANIRVALGRRFGRLAVEGFMMVHILEGRDSLSSGFHEMGSYGLSGRYMFPVGRNLELYLRGGLQKNVLSVDTGRFEDVSFQGRGLHYGAGAQIKGKVPVLGLVFWPLFFTNYGPKMTGALWLETNHQMTRLHNPNYSSVDAGITSWTLGFGLGSDF